jgi:uncharacterized membrane protein YgcG
MRRLLVALWLWCGVASLSQADERILAWQSDIRVRPDSVLEVVETLEVRAEGRQIRRGILRDFPTRYTDRRGRRVIVGFDVLDVTRDGESEPFTTERMPNGVRVRIGDPEVYLDPGVYTYRIVYRTDRQLGFFEAHDELYWNVTGNGWDFPIDRAVATVALPPGVPVDRIGLEGYTGPQGATGRDWDAWMDGEAPTFETTRSLAAREGLTIVVTWPKGYVAPPTGWASVRHFWRDAWPALVGVGGLLLLLVYYLRAWTEVGRDPKGRIVIPRYAAPEGQSPASMRYLLRMGYDDRCLAAAILSLAVKGFLRIHHSRTGLFGTGSEYVLQRLDPPAGAAASDDEAQVLRDLFRKGETLEIEQENHAILRAARSAHEASLKQRYTPSLFRINGGWHAAGVVLSLLVAGLAIVAPLLGGSFEPPWLVMTPAGWITLGAVGVGLVSNGVFGRLLKAPTIAGRSVMDGIEGFRLYLDVAEGEDLGLVDEPPLTPGLFEQNLPAALALGVEQNWAERFAEVFAGQAAAHSPGWYEGDGWDVGNVSRFSSGFGSSLDGAISSASTAPGSSSGSGGGGSSGGGGGGGGGGGW